MKRIDRLALWFIIVGYFLYTPIKIDEKYGVWGLCIFFVGMIIFGFRVFNSD